MNSIKIDKNFEKFIVHEHDFIRHALSKITANKSKIVFVVNEAGILQGSFTDGDFRRWISNCSGDVDISTAVSAAMNSECIKLPLSSSHSKILDALTTWRSKSGGKIYCLPLIDSNGRIKAVAIKGIGNINIGNFGIGQDYQTFIIAEIGNNHNGCLQNALQLIDAAIAGKLREISNEGSQQNFMLIQAEVVILRMILCAIYTRSSIKISAAR